MKNAFPSKSAKVLAVLGVLSAAGIRADMISFRSFPGFQRPGSGFDCAWNADWAFMTNQALFSAKRFSLSVDAWNREGRAAYLLRYHGSYLAAFPADGDGGSAQGDAEGGVFAALEDRHGHENHGDRPFHPSEPAVPEPTSALPFAGGLLGIALFARRRA